MSKVLLTDKLHGDEPPELQDQLDVAPGGEPLHDLGDKEQTEADLRHFDASVFSKFFPKSAPPTKAPPQQGQATTLPGDGNKQAEVEQILQALRLEEDSKSEERKRGNSPVAKNAVRTAPAEGNGNNNVNTNTTADVMDDFDHLNRIFSNERLQTKAMPPAEVYHPYDGRATGPFSQPGQVIPGMYPAPALHQSMSQHYEEFLPPPNVAINNGHPTPRRNGQPLGAANYMYTGIFGSPEHQYQQQGNTPGDVHNTSLTTAPSLGHLEKAEFIEGLNIPRSTTPSQYIKNDQLEVGYFPSTSPSDTQPFSARGALFFGYVPQPTQQGTFMMPPYPMPPQMTEPPGYYDNAGMGHQSRPDEYGAFYDQQRRRMTLETMASQPRNLATMYFPPQERKQSKKGMFGPMNPDVQNIGNGKNNAGQYGKPGGGNGGFGQRMGKGKYGGGLGQNQGGGGMSGGYYHNGPDEETFEIDPNRIESNPKTTLMVKNIPNKYNLPLMLETIDANHKGKYDFFYLPIDFRNNCNVGYAFINFSDIRFIRLFYEEFHNKRWEKFNSEKICEIKYARIQGRDALIGHFQYSSVMNQSDKKLKPLILPKSDLSTIETLVQQQKAKKAKDEQTTATKKL